MIAIRCRRAATQKQRPGSVRMATTCRKILANSSGMAYSKADGSNEKEADRWDRRLGRLLLSCRYGRGRDR